MPATRDALKSAQRRLRSRFPSPPVHGFSAHGGRGADNAGRPGVGSAPLAPPVPVAPDVWVSGAQPGSRERGSAMLALVLVTLSLTAMGIAYVASLPTTLRAMRERRALTSARFLALGAGAEAQQSLQNGGSGNLDGNAYDGTLILLPATTGSQTGAGGPVTGGTGVAELVRALPNGSFAARVRTLADGTTLIESAAVEEAIVRHVAWVVRRVATRPYSRALFGRTAIEGRSGVLFADSFDSRAGKYSDQDVNLFTAPNGRTWKYARKRAMLGADGAIELPDGVVLGSVHPGPGSAFLPSSDTYVTGSTAPSAATTDPPPAIYTVPSQNDNARLGSLLRGGNTIWAVGGGDDAIIQAGTYVVQSFESSKQDVKIKGDVTIYVRGSFIIGANSKVRVEKGASLRVYSDGSLIDISGDGIDNKTRVPANVRFYAAADPSGKPAPSDAPPRIFLDGDKAFIGTIYAPESRVEFRRQKDFQGSIVADVIRLDASEHRIHYDEALSQLADSAPQTVRYETVGAWRLGP